MLPPPALSFTIPSIHDDLVLQCRVYHPTCLAPTKFSHIQEWRKRAAVVAHPYAPLGGSYDDPVVDIVASVILKHGFIVGTFNFRGAGTSKGRTSWQSKAERNDYISFVGFMIYYLHHLSPPSLDSCLDQSIFTRSDPELHDLSPIPSQALPQPHSTDYGSVSPTSPTSPSSIPQIQVQVSQTPMAQSRLLLAGYSYGAMITSSLPPAIGSMIQPFQTPLPGSAHAEIRMRAESLADQQNELMNTRVASLLSQMPRRGRILNIEDHILSSPNVRRSSGGVRTGGEENLRRASHESYRSKSSFTIETPERVRKSLDRVRSMARPSRVSIKRANSPGSLRSLSKKKCSKSETSIESIGRDQDNGISVEKAIKEIPGILYGLQTAYLIISPLHGWVSNLARMWSSQPGKEREMEPDMKFALEPTLALFGDDDIFVSVRKLRAWAEKLNGMKKDDGEKSLFSFREVPGAGHFWHDYDAIQILQEEVRVYVASL